MADESISTPTAPLPTNVQTVDVQPSETVCLEGRDADTIPGCQHPPNTEFVETSVDKW